MRSFTVGTRGSALALWQTRDVSARLTRHGATVKEKIITTQGDVNLADRLQGSIEKGFFTQELEAELHDRTIDWAVHSLKDLPTRMPKGLVLGAVLERAPASDLLLVRLDALDDAMPLSLKEGARVGSSSLRREHLLRRHAPKANPLPLRGNVPTRVEKLKKGENYEAILLAEAGVTRLALDLSGLAVFRLNPKRWVCAPGQGAVAVQCREDDAEVRSLLSHLNHAATNRATALERDFLRVLEGGCTTPFGAFIEGEVVHLGLAKDNGWTSTTAKLVAEPTEGWMQSQLDTLSSTTSQEEAHEWLSRRL
jgi:hydroxymethylbilane synthase